MAIYLGKYTLEKGDYLDIWKIMALSVFLTLAFQVAALPLGISN